jgi:hypothetical protein
MGHHVHCFISTLTLFVMHQFISFIIFPKDATDILSTRPLVMRPQNGVQVRYGVAMENGV